MSKTLYNLCNNNLPAEFGNLTEQLYEERSQIFFDPNIVKLKNKLNISWRDFYFRIEKFLIDQSRDNRGYFIESDAQKFLVENKLLELLALNEKYNLNFDVNNLINAIDSNSFDVLQWLIEEKNIKDSKAIASVQSIEMLIYLLSVLDYTEDDLVNLANQSTYRENMEILNWLYDNKQILPDLNSIEIFSRGKLKVIEWLYEKGVKFTSENIDQVLSFNLDDKERYNLVVWLLSTGVEPTLDNMQTALASDSILVMKLLYNKYNINPNDQGILEAIENNSARTLIWLFQNGFTLSKDINNE